MVDLKKYKKLGVLLTVLLFLFSALYYLYTTGSFENIVANLRPPTNDTSLEETLNSEPFSQFSVSEEYLIPVPENGTSKVLSFELTRQYLTKDTLFLDGKVVLENNKEVTLIGFKPLGKVYANVEDDPEFLYDAPVVTFLNDANGELFIEVKTTPEVIYFHRVIDGVTSSLFLQAYEITPTEILFIQNAQTKPL
ncbi:MAG: hypothetical protein ACOZAO_05485 [Patescibacteria group bacterium]